MARKNKIPKIFNRGKTYWSKKHIDAYFSSKDPDADITEWYSVQEVQDKFQMSLNAIYSFVYKNAIPKKKVGICILFKKALRYSKGNTSSRRTPILHNSRGYGKIQNNKRPAIPLYQVSSNFQDYKKGKYTLISKPELDNLFEDPIIE